MKLTLAERASALNYLPNKEDYHSLLEIRRARECLAWRVEEKEEADKHTMDTPGGKVYEPKHLDSVVVDVPLSQWAVDLIRKGLREKCEKHDLMDKEVSLYQKFIVDFDQVA